MSKKLEDFKGLVSALLARMGLSAEVSTISVELVDAEVNTLTIQGLGIGVDVGYPIQLRSIAGNRVIPGYRVFYLRTHAASRWQPEEVEDVTKLETDGYVDALQAVGALIVQQMVREIREAQFVSL